MKRTNIQERLSKAKKSFKGEEKILEEVQAILENVQIARDKIQNKLEDSSWKSSNAFKVDLLQPDKIYHIDQIKKICIDYRLRFLDSNFFKGVIAEEAITKVHHLEKQHRTELSGFKILAPSKMFKLKDKDDPILFAPIGEGYFYLIHKWGNDLHPLRKILMWPFKNIVNLTWFVLLISYFLTLLIPNGLFSRSSSTAEFGILFFFTFKSVVAIVIFYGISLGKNFNNAIWNSRYINF
ncbi:MAG: hypothetical protein ACR2MT_14990 [Aurantibacter sp.]